MPGASRRRSGDRDRVNEKLGKEIGETPSSVDQLTVNGHLALHWTLSGEASGAYPGTDADATLVFNLAVLRPPR